MRFPILNEVNRGVDVTTVFGGYNASAQDGEFIDMKNMTSKHYPVLAPRGRRGFVKSLLNPLALLDKDSLVWVDGEHLYKNGEMVDLGEITLDSETEKTLVKMGGILVIMPDGVWVNMESGECGKIRHTFSLVGSEITFEICDGQGKAVTWHDAKYYETHEPKEGDYLMGESNGKASLKQYSATTRIWSTVASPYMQIKATGIGNGFKDGDGLKLSISASVKESWSDVSNVFVNEEGDYLTTNTVIKEAKADSITIAGISKANHTLSGIEFTAERKIPDLAFVTECGNRLWGCSKDGHEMYCCKLGDVTNWNCFAGISTDSWAATVGSDGKFTGAVSYQGYPFFFKEDMLIRINISTTGAHQYKEMPCRGVQNGSHKSLCVVGEVLYYKANDCVCMFTGASPVSVSEVLGEVRYHSAVGGTIGDRYYISMKDGNEKSHLFVYDTEKRIWVKEDHTEISAFCKYDNDLYFLTGKNLVSVCGSLPFAESLKESDVDFYAVSGKIGYQTNDRKYISKLSIRLTMESNCSCEVYLSYDSSDSWEHILSMSGTGTRTYSIPVIPRRCDHFQYKIRGTGNVKVLGITKVIEQGSDI